MIQFQPFFYYTKNIKTPESYNFRIYVLISSE